MAEILHKNQNKPCWCARLILSWIVSNNPVTQAAIDPYELDRPHNCTEYIADRGAEQGQNNDYNNRDQNKNQRIFHKTLTLFLRSEQHGFHLLSSKSVSLFIAS
jgi:hypothetical protein